MLISLKYRANTKSNIEITFLGQCDCFKHAQCINNNVSNKD